MATYQCPKGHASTDPDYCSECGALIGQSAVPTATAAPVTSAPSSGADVCPDCMTPRTPGARFCEVCRYDFTAGTSGVHASPPPAAPVAPQAPAATPPPPVASAAPVSAASSAAPPAQAATANTPIAGSTPAPAPAQRLNVVVITDPSLVEDEEERNQCPQNAPELVFPLDLEENLVGRRSDDRGIYPEVDINDPGVSHRHLKFIRQADGSFVVLEMGSKNGTILNGAELKPGLPTPIAVGDELLVGSWTRLQIRGR
ncbi:MAG TPA: FHA domain-containing protein [Ktedonobacterales bacterium]|nr:FHA domain-containing protein [Ktedonobacterales bacterium]